MDVLLDLLSDITTSLQRKKWRISTAESCTGGLLASYLTKLPGSSTWFERGFVTYSNLSKQEMLGVEEALINKEGAVSEMVARAMALGALKHSKAEIALSITGIAGPEGGSAFKPVGTVCFAWALPDNILEFETTYFPSVVRDEIRELSCKHSLERLLRLLNQ